MVQEHRSKLGLVQTRPAEVISGGPVAQEGADTLLAAGNNILADTVYGVHSSSWRGFPNRLEPSFSSSSICAHPDRHGWSSAGEGAGDGAATQLLSERFVCNLHKVITAF